MPPSVALLQKQGKQPDFRMRDNKVEGRKTAVWIEDRKFPAWAKANLQLLPGGQPYQLPDFIPASAMNGSEIEQQWVNVFTNYNGFWDNRVNVSLGGCRAYSLALHLHKTCTVDPALTHAHMHSAAHIVLLNQTFAVFSV